MMLTAKTKAVSIEIITSLLVLVFLYTGLTKLIDYKSFRLQMMNNPYFYNYANIVTFGAPLLEILIGILLVAKKTRRKGLWASFFLMLFFSWYVWHLMRTFPKLPCSCGGIIAELNWPQHLALNIALTVLTLFAIYFDKTLKHFNYKKKLVTP